MEVSKYLPGWIFLYHDFNIYCALILNPLEPSLKSDIEAEMSSPLLKLPDDPELLTTLAMEDMTQQAAHNERTLAVYRDKVRHLW